MIMSGDGPCDKKLRRVQREGRRTRRTTDFVSHEFGVWPAANGTDGLRRHPVRPRPLVRVYLRTKGRPERPDVARGRALEPLAVIIPRDGPLHSLPERLMLAAEYEMQVPFASLAFGPSLFFMARRQVPR